MHSSSSPERRAVTVQKKDSKVTIEDLRRAYEAAQRDRNLKQLEFEELVASLKEEGNCGIDPAGVSL